MTKVRIRIKGCQDSAHILSTNSKIFRSNYKYRYNYEESCNSELRIRILINLSKTSRNFPKKCHILKSKEIDDMLTSRQHILSNDQKNGQKQDLELKEWLSCLIRILLPSRDSSYFANNDQVFALFIVPERGLHERLPGVNVSARRDPRGGKCAHMPRTPSKQNMTGQKINTVSTRLESHGRPCSQCSQCSTPINPKTYLTKNNNTFIATIYSFRRYLIRNCTTEVVLKAKNSKPPRNGRFCFFPA